MKFRLLIFTIIISIILSISGTVALADEISLYVNNAPVKCDVPPVILNDRTMVPARALFEALGARVSWNAEKQQVTARTDDTRIILVIGSNVAYVDSVVKILDSSPVIIDGRTLIPARFVSESLGYEVKWFEKTRSVYISKQKKPTTDKNESITVPNTKPSDDTQEDTENDTAPVKKSKITSMVYSISGNNFVMKFTFSSPLDGYNLYNLDNPIRTVLELKGAENTGSNTINIQSGGILQIRTANHDDYYKVVADLEQVLQKKFVLASNKLSATLTLTAAEDIEDSDIESDLPSTNQPSEEDSDVDPDKYWDTTNPIVVLDAGHGGSDVGAIGYNEEGVKVVYEKDVNLAITLEVARILNDRGISVILTRSEDTSLTLNKRCTISNTNDADLFVSIHHNSHTTSDPSGSLTLYSEAKDEKYPNLKSSKSIAKTIQKHLVKATGLYDGGIRSEDQLAVLKNTETSAVLIEVAFVSNYDDQQFMLEQSNLELAAAGIADGILEVLSD